MAKGIRYTEEYKKDAVSQVVERRYSVREVLEHIGISVEPLYSLIKTYKTPEITLEVI